MQNYIWKNKEKLLLKFGDTIQFVSLYKSQLRELVIAENPVIKGDDKKIDAAVSNLEDEGLPESHFVYYPWRNTAYEILPEKEFISVRTNRNRLKIKEEEQAVLTKKKIAVAGLSVGNAVALTCAMERICGALHLADYDDLELSNLNRLRAGLPDCGLQKTEIAARQIAELDPYIQVKTFDDGVTAQNVDEFLDESVDVLVEVCDSIDLKFLLRRRAKELKIPVVMDTNDRGMIDIERFDLEPNRPLFHGAVKNIDTTPDALRDPANKMKVVQAIIGNQLSPRLMQSMPEIGKTLCSWPQLASGVMLGGAASAHVCRRILLGEQCPSGRFFVDLADIIKL